MLKQVSGELLHVTRPVSPIMTFVAVMVFLKFYRYVLLKINKNCFLIHIVIMANIILIYKQKYHAYSVMLRKFYVLPTR